jgi:hydroxymethylbilane synthase
MSAEGPSMESSDGNRPPLQKIVLGTRGSELARTQARMVADRLHPRWPALAIETKIIRTLGDESDRKTKSLDRRAGRKGLFTAAIERALLAHEVDLGVHSAKDLPSELNRGVEIAAVLPRGLVNDVLVAKQAGGMAALAEGAIIATGSVRRKHQINWQYPRVETVDLRGNVPTRLRKLAENNWDAIVLAQAGLERLGLSPARNEINFEGRKFFVEILSCEIFLPAGGQGIIALQIRRNDESSREIVDPINDRDTLLCLRAEREFLRLLQGDCQSPVGVLAEMENGKMKLHAQIFEHGSALPREGEVVGAHDDGEHLAAQLLKEINGE